MPSTLDAEIDAASARIILDAIAAHLCDANISEQENSNADNNLPADKA
jgi:hypothetical protein